MNIHLKRSCATMAVAISLLPVSGHATEAVGSRCYAAPIAGNSSNQPFAKLDVNAFRKCVSIAERLNVLTLNPGSPFASTCAAERLRSRWLFHLHSLCRSGYIPLRLVPGSTNLTPSEGGWRCATLSTWA